MVEVVHLRHSLRDPGGVHLNPIGAARARALAGYLGPFDRVISSPVPRAWETASAFRTPPDETWEALAEAPEAVGRAIDARRPVTFGEYLALSREMPAAGRLGRDLLGAFASAADAMDPPGRLLVVSHGGLVELTAAAAVGDAVREWGASAAPAEGWRMHRGGGRWTSGAPVRLADAGSD